LQKRLLPEIKQTMQQFLRYRLVKEIGSGGMAKVYLAEDTVLNRYVAIKMVHQHLLDRPDMLRRFNTEAQAVASVSHENVIKIFDCGQADGKRYIVMEYIEGASLFDLHEKFPVIPNLVLVEILRQILSGLVVVHEKNIIHRDIKPGNIMIDRHGCVKIMDFGIAYLVNQQSITMTGTFIGSPSHISPEQAEGKPVTGKTDIFSLGAMCYESASGAHPFVAENAQVTIHRVINHTPRPPYEINKQVLLWLSDLIETMLIKDSANRPDAAGCINKLEEIYRKDGIAFDRNRILSFFTGSAEYIKKEQKELFELYRANADIEFKSGHIPNGMRYVNQAESFGRIDTGIQKVMTTASRKKTLSVVLLIILITSVLFFAGFAAWHISGRPALIKQIQPAIAENANAIQGNKFSAVAIEAADSDVLKTSKIDTVDRVFQAPVASSKSVYSQGKKISRRTTSIKAPEFNTQAAEKVILQKPANEAVGFTGNEQPKNNQKAKQQSGYLEIVTNPPWTNVIIDGSQWGQTPRIQIIPLSCGSHVLQLQKDGFESYSEQIIVQESDTLRKRLKLQQSVQ
jgi:serine/threonine protein kinase